MSEVTRPAGHRGVQESHRPEVQLSKFRVGAPTPPPEGDVTMGLTEWGMLGNGPTPGNIAGYPQGCGDCGVAAFEHARMAKALVGVSGDGTPVYEEGFEPATTEATQALYAEYGRAMGEPGEYPDQGVKNATWLHWLWERGKIDWYAELDPHNLDEVHQAMLDCKGVLTAVALPVDAEAQFARHEPWRLDTTQLAGGHDILLVRYAPTGETFVTWGALQDALVTWDAACIMDAWVFGTREDAERAGYDYEAIVAAIRSAGGRVVGGEPAAAARKPRGLWAFVRRVIGWPG